MNCNCKDMPFNTVCSLCNTKEYTIHDIVGLENSVKFLMKVNEDLEDENERLIAANKNLQDGFDQISKDYEELFEFAQEVRRTGDTRLSSMAIAVISKVL